MPSKLVTLGRTGATDGRYPAVNIGYSRSIDPQVSRGLDGLARAAGGAEVPFHTAEATGGDLDGCEGCSTTSRPASRPASRAACGRPPAGSATAATGD